MKGEFEREKQRLRELYKRYKAGLVRESEISEKDAALLQKYYGL